MTRGILAVVFGIILLMWPGVSFSVFILLFGLYAVIGGVLAIASVFTQQMTGWSTFATVIEGILGIVIGGATLFMPGAAAYILLLMISVWAVASGLLQIAAGVQLQQHEEEKTSEWLLFLNGIISILLGVVILSRPIVGTLTVMWLMGTYAVLFGILLIALSVRLKSFVEHGARRM